MGFSPFGSRYELIDTGEIDLSQALLAADLALRPAYPLVAGLLDDPCGRGAAALRHRLPP